MFQGICVKIKKADGALLFTGTHMPIEKTTTKALKGWKDNPISATNFAGTNGQNAKLEVVQMKLLNATSPMSIHYSVHIAGCGWNCPQGIPNESSDGGTAGTTGRGAGIEAIKIWLTDAPGYRVNYRAYLQGSGWEPSWQSDAAIAGTVGKGVNIEALNVQIVAANEFYRCDTMLHR
jgi:uncharacterized protein YjdB